MAWAWVRTHKWSGASIEGLDHLAGWLGRMRERPACQRGVEVPFKLPNMSKDKKAAKDFIDNARKGVQR